MSDSALQAQLSTRSSQSSVIDRTAAETGQPVGPRPLPSPYPVSTTLGFRMLSVEYLVRLMDTTACQSEGLGTMG